MLAAMDRRKSARTRADVPVIAYQNGTARQHRVIDLSTSGALIQRSGTWRPPMVQRVELRLGGQRTVSGMARTVWADGGLHAVRFVNLSDVDRLDIAEHMDHLQGRGPGR